MKLLQKDVAAVLGVDATMINDWERNRCQPKLCLIPKIVEFLGYNAFPPMEGDSVPERIKRHRLMVA